MLKHITDNNTAWLFLILVNKESKAKYKSTTLGFLWAFANPLIQMLVLSLVFKFFIRLPITNYPVFAFSALLPWTFFNFAVTNGTYSLLENKDFLKKAYFNRMLIPTASVTSNFINLLISLAIFITYLALTTHIINFLNFLILLLAIAILYLLIFSLVLIFSSLNLFFRDIYYLLQAAMLALFYLSPIIYPSSFVPRQYHAVYQLNPLVGAFSLFRTSLINHSYFNQSAVLISIIETCILLLIANYIFKRREPYFTDWI